MEITHIHGLAVNLLIQPPELKSRKLGRQHVINQRRLLLHGRTHSLQRQVNNIPVIKRQFRQIIYRNPAGLMAFHQFAQLGGNPEHGHVGHRHQASYLLAGNSLHPCPVLRILDARWSAESMELFQMGGRHAGHVKQNAAGSGIQFFLLINQIAGQFGNGAGMAGFKLRLLNQKDFQTFFIEPDQHTIH